MTIYAINARKTFKKKKIKKIQIGISATSNFTALIFYFFLNVYISLKCNLLWQ